MATADPTPITYTCDVASYATKYGKETARQMQAIFQGCSPQTSFMTASTNYGIKWSGSAMFGAIVGFTIFGIMYVFTIISIIHDIFKRQAEYEKLVEEDIARLNDLGVNVTELAAELETRLSDKGHFENADDQLIGEAFKLQKGEF